MSYLASSLLLLSQALDKRLCERRWASDHKRMSPAETLQTNSLCEAMKRHSESGKPVDLFYAYRCATMDIITYLCFGQDIDAANAPDFQQPLIKAMADSTSIVVYFKHFPLFRKMITGIPPERAMKSNPKIAGLLRMQQVRTF